jgi:hypothetical protein
MTQPREFSYASFMIRLWRLGTSDTPAAVNHWQCEVEQIQSGQQWKFYSIEEMLQFLEKYTDQSECKNQFFTNFE